MFFKRPLNRLWNTIQENLITYKHRDSQSGEVQRIVQWEKHHCFHSVMKK